MQESATSASAAETGRSWSTLGEVLRHPLLLLLVGGALSALTAVLVTQRWQDRQRRLDVQRAFVADMTRAVVTDVAALDRFDSALAGYPSYTAAELRRQRGIADHADEAWVVASFTIGARLAAYYPRGDVAGAWGKAHDAVEDIWALEQTDYLALDAKGAGKAHPPAISGVEYTRIFRGLERIRALLAEAVAALLGRRPDAASTAPATTRTTFLSRRVDSRAAV